MQVFAATILSETDGSGKMMAMTIAMAVLMMMVIVMVVEWESICEVLATAQAACRLLRRQSTIGTMTACPRNLLIW